MTPNAKAERLRLMKRELHKLKETECRRCLGTGEGLPGESKDGYSGYCKDCGGTGEQGGAPKTTAEESSSLQRRVRSARGRGKGVPWLPEEDDMLRYWYGCANGAMTPYWYMAEWLNKHFHGGRLVRKIGAVCRRDGHINYGKPWGRRPNEKLRCGHE